MGDALLPVGTKYEAVRRFVDGFEAASGLIFAKKPKVTPFNIFVQAHATNPHPHAPDAEISDTLRLDMSLWVFRALFMQSVLPEFRPVPDAEPDPYRLYGELVHARLRAFAIEQSAAFNGPRMLAFLEQLDKIKAWLEEYHEKTPLDLLDDFAATLLGAAPPDTLFHLLDGVVSVLQENRKIPEDSISPLLMQPAKDMVGVLNKKPCLLPFGYNVRHTFERSEWDMVFGCAKITKPNAELYLNDVKDRPELKKPFTVQNEVPPAEPAAEKPAENTAEETAEAVTLD